MLVIATPDTLNVRRMIETARAVNPRVEIIVRTHSEKRPRCWKRKMPVQFFSASTSSPAT